MAAKKIAHPAEHRAAPLEIHSSPVVASWASSPAGPAAQANDTSALAEHEAKAQSQPHTEHASHWQPHTQHHAQSQSHWQLHISQHWHWQQDMPNPYETPRTIPTAAYADNSTLADMLAETPGCKRKRSIPDFGGIPLDVIFAASSPSDRKERVVVTPRRLREQLEVSELAVFGRACGEVLEVG